MSPILVNTLTCMKNWNTTGCLKSKDGATLMVHNNIMDRWTVYIKKLQRLDTNIQDNGFQVNNHWGMVFEPGVTI